MSATIPIPSTQASLYVDSDAPSILTLTEAAAFLRCSKAHLSHAINGQIEGLPPLPHLSIGRRKLILRKSLVAWMEQVESRQLC